MPNNLTRKQIESLIRQIFTSGSGERADLLDLISERGVYLGGWAEGPLASFIEAQLKEIRSVKRRKKNAQA